MGKKDTAISSAPMVFLTDISERDKPWDEHRATATTVANHYQLAGVDRRAVRMHDCAKQLWFALQAQDDGELRFRLKNARFCRQRFCPVCQWRRMLMWRARFFKGLPRILEAYPTHRWLLLTLTLKNCPLDELRDTIKGMSKSWDRFVKYKEFPAVGWIRSLEVTRNPDDATAHPHYHVLMMVKPSYFSSNGYVKQSRWRELWQQAIRSYYLPTVDIRAIKPTPGDSHPMARGILETIKYGAKESDLIADPEWLAGLTTQMDKLKTIALGGVLREYLREEEPDDLIHTDEDAIDPELLDQYPTLIFDWANHVKRYVKNSNSEL